MKLKFSQLLPYTILLISISSILQWCSLPIGNTVLWWCIQALIIYCFFKLSPLNYNIWQIKCFLILLVISAVYGAVFMTENYWDWKLLVSNLMVFSLPLVSYAYMHPLILTKTLRLWFRYAWIILIILFPFLEAPAFGKFLVPYTFLALLFPLLNRYYKFSVLIALLILLIFALDARADVLKFCVAILLGFYLQFNGIIRFPRITVMAFIMFFITPVVLFLLAVFGTFNVFNLEEELGIQGEYEIKTYSDTEGSSALADTRTFLYVEELNSAIYNNYTLQGRSIARGYDSVAFGNHMDEAMGIKRGERQSCEVSILNIFNYFGLIGVVSYFLIFYFASYKAVFDSKNSYVPVVGLYVGFRWMIAWVEDFSRFDLNMLMLFIMIGICYSPLYRNMNDLEFKNWIKTIIR